MERASLINEMIQSYKLKENDSLLTLSNDVHIFYIFLSSLFHSIEYWFRCMDLDGDGVVSMYEMEYFHEEQMNKMETLGIERLPFEDTVCQVIYLQYKYISQLKILSTHFILLIFQFSLEIKQLSIIIHR